MQEACYAVKEKPAQATNGQSQADDDNGHIIA